MKIKDFMQQIFNFADPDAELYATGKTCDTLKAGDPEKEFNGKVAVTMFATPDVVRAAAAWGASLLIVHEPTYYDHWDSKETFEAQTGFKRVILDMKKKVIDDSGLVIYRFHDHPHHAEKDMISMGEVKYFGLKGRWVKGTQFGVNEFILDEEMNVRDVAKTLEKNLNIKHVRICGANDFPVKTIALVFGTPGNLETELGRCDIALTGEICEWSQGEFAIDCAQLGLPKAILVMGHCCSERDGMRLLADAIPGNWEGVEAKYFESGDCYTFTDSF